jgi:ABC-type polysaccharide/polyol phosphate export permease
MLHRNLIIVLHNTIVLIAVWIFIRWSVHPSAVLSLAGLVLLYLFLSGTSVIVAIICVRYRDVPPLIQVLIQFLFFLTPVIWYPEQIKFGADLLKFNPLTYMLMIVRDPILGRPVDIQTWVIAVSLTAASLIAGALMYVRFRRRIAYWV